jgi:SAM-dependent methyltransferase
MFLPNGSSTATRSGARAWPAACAALLTLACVAFLAPAAPAAAQGPPPKTTDPAVPAATPADYKPTVGMPGKDAVWVPTGEAMIEKMLDVAKVTPQDFVMDLGSGDGRAIIAAARRGARGLGVEYNPDLVEYSKRQAERAGVADKAQFVQGDMYAADISKSTVLALFLLPSNLEKLKDKFLALEPGTRIVANTFWMPDWTPDETQVLEEGCENWCTAHLFIIPANAAGRWRTGGGELELTQEYQMVEGTHTAEDGVKTPVKGRLRGTHLTLTVGDREYAGMVNGDTMEGTPATGPNPQKQTATRIK